MKKGKASGADNIPTEVWANSATAKEMIFEFLQKIWRKEEVSGPTREEGDGGGRDHPTTTGRGRTKGNTRRRRTGLLRHRRGVEDEDV